MSLVASNLAGRTLRLLVAGFCWMTAAYAFTSASPFAFRQFLAPRVFPALGLFSDWHALLYWPWLALALVGLRDVLGRGGWARIQAAGFGASGVLTGAYLTLHPVLPTLTDDSRSLVVGLLSLVPILWLALLDYVDAWTVAVGPALAHADLADSDESRLFIAAVGTAVFFSIVDGVLTPLAIGGRFEPDLLTAGLAAGLGWNLMDQMVIGCGIFLVVALVERLTGRLPFGVRYTTLLVLLVAAIASVAGRTVYSALGLSGGWLAVVATATAASIVATWGAVRVQRWAHDRTPIASPVELLFGPPKRPSAGVRRVGPLLVLAAAAYVVAAVSRIVDWDFLLIKCGVFALWLIAFDQIFRLPPRRVRVGAVTMAATCLAPLAVYAAASTPAGSAIVPRHALDRYAVYNASFRVADGLLRDATLAGDDSFQRFLRANTGLGSEVDVSPVDVTFAPLDTPAADPPYVFLFVIDSLRHDYLQPYNNLVSFTPNLERFARDSVVFQNAFSVYGATGLSVPAIWSGSAGAHKQYVMPFAPMNALEKLLERNGYRQFLSFDSIVRQLVPRSPSMTELDAGLNNEDFSFCRTAGEVREKLSATAGDPRPAFVYSLPQDLHVSNIIGASVPAGESYPGFHAPYAARVHRIDACFGEFIDFLKHRGWYDRSLIVVTADHGEMLGEEGLWGHVYYLFPPVVQVPLIVHLPAGDARRLPVDPDALSLTTDITPTIYAALGYAPRAELRLMGHSLIGPGEADPPDRRDDGVVLAASYSAVYAALRARGRQLYIVDAVQHREYAYERQTGGPWHAAPVTAGLRESGQRLIRQHIHDINRIYRAKARH